MDQGSGRPAIARVCILRFLFRSSLKLTRFETRLAFTLFRLAPPREVYPNRLDCIRRVR
jgi:hypothetical protein